MNRPLHVLLVEDAIIYHEVIREHLRGDAGIVLDIVGTLAEAAARIKSGGVALVLLDLTLPDADELEAFEAIREHSPSLPIVVVTSSPDKALELRALEEGAQGYLPKGEFSGAELVRSIRQSVIRHKRIADMVEREFAPLRQSLEGTKAVVEELEALEVAS